MPLVSNCVYHWIGYFSDLSIYRTINSSFHFLLFPEKGPLSADLASTISEAPEAEENQDGEEAEESEEDTSSTTSPPPALSEDTGIDKKRKHVDEFASSSTSAQRTAADKAPILEGDVEFFDLMAS
jgi:hypothetical protein